MKVISRILSLLMFGSLLSSTAHAELIYGITEPVMGELPNLVSFDSATPGNLTTIGPLTGVVAGQSVHSMDFCPADGKLYALSTVPEGNAVQLYTVNLTTGALTPVGSGLTLPTNHTSGIFIDFNPVLDRLRVITYTDRDYYINPNDATLTEADAYLSPYRSGIVSLAYNNNVFGAIQTTLYAYTKPGDAIGTIEGDNGGIFSRLGDSGVFAQSQVGFDFSGVTGIGYVSLDAFDTPNNNSEFYTLSHSYFAALIRAGSFNARLRDIAVFLPAPATSSVTIRGMITLEATVNSSQSISFTFRSTTGSDLTRTATLNSVGAYSFSDIPAGEYTVAIKGAKWLRKNIRVDARSGNVTNADASLLAGDANNDNFVDIADLLLLIGHYNQALPNNRYSDATDLNCDGVDDITDLLLLVANYNKMGAA